MENKKSNALNLAKKQFASDLQNDADFIEYKKRCELDYGMSYGVVSASNHYFMLNTIAKDNATLISDYLNKHKSTMY